jgi:UDP-N-acetylmuramoyl-tripeptide--D-alanyl-D-alanine ligase
MRQTFRTLAEWAGGRLANAAPAREAEGVSTDSRGIRPGEVFVALQGPRFDGHRFVENAFQRGAALAVVEREDALGGRPGLIVENSLRALGEMAARCRWAEPLVPWIAVTGSNGKTTTREMLARILRLRGKVVVPPKNYNNLVGLPLTILNRDPEAWIGVLEMGTSLPGDIARLTRIATPTLGIVTNVGAAHLKGLRTLDAVAHEKAAIFETLPHDGVAILPGGHERTDILLSHIHGNRRTFAVDAPGDLVATDVRANNRGVRFLVEGVVFHLDLLGAHNVENALAALLAARHFDIPLEEAAAALEGMRPVAGRLERQALRHLVLYKDTYNANPGSLRAGVDTLLNIDAPRRVVIVGDMLELGPESRALHREAGIWLAESGVDVVLAAGKDCLALSEAAARHSARLLVRHYRSVHALLADVGGLLREGDHVLVKGSRAMNMERVTETLAAWRPR